MDKKYYAPGLIFYQFLGKKKAPSEMRNVLSQDNLIP